MRVEPARGSLRHDPRGGVRRVAHSRIGAAFGDPDLGGEHVAPVDPELERQRALTVGDPPKGAKHTTVVVLEGRRDPGAEEELAPVGVEVGREERDPLRREGLLDEGHGPVEGLGDRVRTRPGEERVGAGEADEGDGGEPVLRVGDRRTEVVAEGVREERAQQVGVGRRQVRRFAGLGMRCPPAQQELTVVTGPDGVAPQSLRGGGADDDLAGLGGLLRLGGGGRPRAEDEELTRGRSDEEEVDVPGVHADRHREGQPSDRGGHGGGLAQGGAHLDGRVAGLLGMVLALEEEEEGVAAELEQLTAPRRGDAQHRPEDPVERLDDLLGADPAPARELLGEGGEAGDVGEDERRVDDAPQRPGGVVVPGERQRRYVPAQVGHVVPSARVLGRLWALG